MSMFPLKYYVNYIEQGSNDESEGIRVWFRTRFMAEVDADGKNKIQSKYRRGTRLYYHVFDTDGKLVY